MAASLYYDFQALTIGPKGAVAHQEMTVAVAWFAMFGLHVVDRKVNDNPCRILRYRRRNLRRSVLLD